MKNLIGYSACILLLLTLNVSAQSRSGGGTNPGSNPGMGTRNPLGSLDLERPTFISGKIVLPDGNQISEPVAIQSICSNRRRIETYTDWHGNFNFELKKKSDTMGPQLGEISSLGEDAYSQTQQLVYRWHDCEIQAILPGFTAEPVMLARYMFSNESTDIGRITLRPVGNVEGSTLSATTLAAPKDARKAWEKAYEQEKKNNLNDARQSLEKAVQIYPQFAAAWAELGRMQYMSHDSAGARRSFEQSLAADSKYIKPYLGLAQLSFDAQQWQALVEITDKLLALNSVSFPAAWFLNAAGNYNLQKYDAAENSTRNGLKMDSLHRIPRMEYLMGLVLVKKNDYAQAGEHIRLFLKLSDQPAEIAEAQKQLAQIEQLSASAVAEKK